MTIATIVSTIGSIPLFSLRTFFPAFLFALFYTHPNLFPGLIEDAKPIEEGSFLAQNWLLILLGILSALEFIGDKIPEIKSIMKEAEPYMKPASYFAVEMGVINESGTEVINQVQWASFNPSWILIIFGMLSVYYLSSLRKDFIDFLQDIDEDDNLFIGQIISWLEDSLVLFGFLLLIWAGIAMVIIYIIIIVIFIYFRKKHERKVEKQKIECSNCNEKNTPFAVNCFNCSAKQNQIYEIGLLGQKQDKLAIDISQHQFNLLSHRRCPNCGNKIKKNTPNQTCTHCNTMLFENPSVKDFKKRIDKKFYKILVSSIILGFIPIIGFLVSAVLANFYLFAPYRKYISKKGSIITKLFINLLTFIFFLLGIAFGFIAAPIYCLMRYYIWKSKFEAVCVNNNIK
jgi:Na+-transporting methylmalonyl-CoA/oxaloacetate decarboxylase gamma subunit